MDTISIVISSSFLIVSSVFYLRSKLPRATIDNQKELINVLDAKVKLLEAQSNEDKRQNLENVKAIADLQGQIKVYKEIPLQQIAESMKLLLDTNKLILDRLEVIEQPK